MITVLNGDWIEMLRTLPDESVHTCVTSPPYWQLRDYGVPGQLGLEKTPEEYVAKMVEGFREVRRVLRKDGTCWVNLGDSYASSTGKHSECDSVGEKQATNAGSVARGNKIGPGLKPKDISGIPWRVAFALQADGWYLRQDIIWNKPAPMPESITDRCTKAHEYIFLLTKSPRYFYDAEAIKEPVSGNAHPRGNGVNPKAKTPEKNSRIFQDRDPQHSALRKNRQNESFSAAVAGLVAKRNKRSVWTIASSPFKGAHFATFPSKLVEPCILAGTSAYGACSQCGAPYERMMQKGKPLMEWRLRSGSDSNGEYHGENRKDYAAHMAQEASSVKARILAGMVERITIGWKPTCRCGCEGVVPCTVLDPFGGSGTVGQVALENGRSAILVELNKDYLKLINERTGLITPKLNIA